jgi:hypothetical protein
MLARRRRPGGAGPCGARRPDAVGDLREVAAAQLLLVLQAERAVVGGDHLTGRWCAGPATGRPGARAWAQRRRAHVLGALEVGLAELVLQRQVQVLRAGLGEDVLRPRRAPWPPRRAPCDATGARCRAGSPGDLASLIARWWPRPRAPCGRVSRGRSGVGLAAASACSTSTSIAMPFSACIMIMAPLSRPLHGAQDLAVVAVEDARVGHEQLEAGDALVDQQVHLLERLVVVAVRDDHVEAVVDGAVAVGLGVPGVEALLQRPRRCSARRSR